MIKSTIDLLETAKGEMTDEKIAEKIGVNRTTLSVGRKRGHLGAYTAAKLAKIAGINEVFAVALAGAEAEKDKKGRAYLLSKVGGSLGGLEIDINEEQNDKKKVGRKNRNLYIMSNYGGVLSCCIFAIVNAIFTIVELANLKKALIAAPCKKMIFEDCFLTGIVEQ